MDQPQTLAAPDAIRPWRQHTLKAAISCVGVAVHSGKRATVTIRPAEANHGIAFRRTDLNRTIPARYDHVIDTRLATVIADAKQASARVAMVEHLMAAFAAKGIDNAFVEVDGSEMPILDGSAAPYLFLLDCAGTVEQDAAREIIEIRKTIRVTDGQAYAEFRPLRGTGVAPTLELDVTIDFTAPAIGRQGYALRLSARSFRAEVSRARTFALAGEVEQLRQAGYARGGSLDNAVVVDGDRVMNPDGLRMENEFARHKLVDAVGDLSLAGAALHGRFVAYRTGHGLNNKLLRALFADRATWKQSAARSVEAAAA
jgi:UDP-3-O-[3-hydroxymyristoyl] N-acetylglucosamine deacetylase